MQHKPPLPAEEGLQAPRQAGPISRLLKGSMHRDRAGHDFYILEADSN